MWITTVTYDLAAMRALDDADRNNYLKVIQDKKDELQLIDNAGNSIPEYAAPDDHNDIPVDQSTLTIKRAWNQEANAQAFIDHVIGLDWVTATLEEQV